jgi:hypothetical protein
MAGYLGQSQPVAASGNSVETDDIKDGAVTDVKLNSTKLNAIDVNANNYVKPSSEPISYISGLQSALDTKTTPSYVDTKVASLVASAPATLDTLNELAAALGDDANHVTTMTNLIGDKLPLAGGTLSGNLNVTGNVNSTGEMRITNPSANSQLYLYGASGYKANIILNEYGVRSWHIGAGTYTSGQFSISDGTNERLRISQTGNVGINSTGSNAKLEVVATSGEVFRADSASGAYRIVANQTGVNMQGNVGIAGSLGVTGSARLNSTSDGNDAFRFYRQDGTLTGALYTWGSKFNIQSYSSQTINLSGADVKVNTGNLVIGTAGKGIDFSGNSNASGMTSELLDDYEEGTWTPTFSASSGGTTYATYGGGPYFYTKIGRSVHFSGYFHSITFNNITNGTYVILSGLPFAADGAYGGIALAYANGNLRSLYVQASNTYAYLCNEGGVEFLQASNDITGNRFMISGHYTTNA